MGIGLSGAPLMATTAVDATGQLYDGTRIDGPGCAARMAQQTYSTQFVQGRGGKTADTTRSAAASSDPDMPLVRALARDASRNENRFSALVVGIVKSKPFQMNTKVADPPATNTVGNPPRETEARSEVVLCSLRKAFRAARS